jgi:ectoine hydroxylase-related dioxygenase (phytanoyl-CoA dioxygenase family)
MEAQTQAAARHEPQVSPFDVLARDYHQSGYGIVRGLFAPHEIAALDAELKQLVDRRGDLIETNNLRCRWQDDTATGACVFDAFDPVIDLSPACASVARDPRVLELIAALYGEPACLFKDKVIFKPPGATGYAMHQDYIAWPSFPRSFLTLIVAIDESSAASGCTEVFPGYHKQGCLTPEDGNYHELPAGLIDESRGVKLELAPGDAAFFSGFTPHRSGPNRSRRWRRQLYFSYNAQSDGGECREAHYDEFRQWLRERYAEYGRTEVYFA